MSGYIERLQRPENLVYFFHDIVGVDCMMLRDAAYRLIKACRKQFLHYYWYVPDPVMDP